MRMSERKLSKMSFDTQTGLSQEPLKMVSTKSPVQKTEDEKSRICGAAKNHQKPELIFNTKY